MSKSVRCRPSCHQKIPAMDAPKGKVGPVITRACRKPVSVVRNRRFYCRQHDPDRDLAAERLERELRAYVGFSGRYRS